MAKVKTNPLKTEKLWVGPFEIDIHYKKMKNIYLKLKPDGKLVISAPIGTKNTTITAFVNSRTPWINGKLTQLEMRQQSVTALKKDEMLLFGQPSSEKLSEAAQQQLLHEKITFYYEKYWPFFQGHGCVPVEIKYRKMTATWGVCRPIANTITFNKQLIHQPVAFVEYVVLHELCHLLVPNHSKDFYRLVRHHMPHYKAYENARIIC